MAPIVTVYTTPPEALVERLTRSHLPHALPLVRRLRFTRLPGGITEHSRILWSSSFSLEEDHHYHYIATGGGQSLEGTGKGKGRETPFAAAYLDLSRGPETELWIYSSMEHRLGSPSPSPSPGTEEEEEEEEEESSENQDQEKGEIACAVALLGEVKRQQDLYFTPGSERESERDFPTVLVGNLNEVLRERLVTPNVGMKIVSTGIFDKWIFCVDELPDVKLPEFLGGVGVGDGADGKGEGMGKRWAWDNVRREDIPFTISRTKIPRKERTMKLLPSTAIYLDDGKPIAWAFLGPDSSLSSLHCEELYRGKGIAKAVAVRVLRDHLKDYGDEGHGYGWADVAPDNTQSQGVCRSLGGQAKWQISWSRLDLDQSFPNQ
ncbi:hypothetical protein HD806DRAFT_530532 [Xylariaceae sp. AK1471]|nr:hypothetical protein HD806DRAFT_530532 [Xylariaceae sp. AK1471]